MQEILNIFSKKDLGTTVSLQACEIAADVVLTSFMQTMTAMKKELVFNCDQVFATSHSLVI